MFLVRKPDRDYIDRFLGQQSSSEFSYPFVGLSKEGKAPPGFVIDHNRTILGRGEEVWNRGIQGIRSWQMFNFDWVQLAWPTSPISIGSTVGVLVKHLGFFSLNTSRIVYLVDESGPTKRFGFAYGTLLEHGESGEERFTVEWRPDDTVLYDLFAFSRPANAMVKLGRPFARHLQRRFAADSMAAMKRFVHKDNVIKHEGVSIVRVRPTRQL